MANNQAGPQDLSPCGTPPTTAVQSLHQALQLSVATTPTMSSVTTPTTTTTTLVAVTVPSPSTTPALSSAALAFVDGPLSAPMHKVGVPLTSPASSSPSPGPGQQRAASTPLSSGVSPRSLPLGPPTTRDAEGQRVIVTTRTPIFVRSYTHAQTTQSSPNPPMAPRMTAATIRPTPTGQVMPTAASMGMVQQVRPISGAVRPISGAVRPMRGHARSAPPGMGRGNLGNQVNHGNQVRIMAANGAFSPTSPQAMMQARAQIRAQGRSPSGLVIRERTPPLRSPMHAIRGQQQKIRIPISAGTGRGVPNAHSPVLITGTQVRAPFFHHGSGSPTLLATYQPGGNPRLQAALSANHMAGTSVAMTSSGQLIIHNQAKMSPGNGQFGPRVVSTQIRHGLVSPTRARMPSTILNPLHPHNKPILPSPTGRSISNQQLLAVAGAQQHQQQLQQAHRPTAQIRAHLPRISPRPPPVPIQAHSHHQVSSDQGTHHSTTPDVAPMNLVTSPKGSSQVQPVDMSAKSSYHTHSSTAIPTQSHLLIPSRTALKSEGSDSDTSSKHGQSKVTSTARATSSTSHPPQPTAGSTLNASQPMEVEEGGRGLPQNIVDIPKELPKEIPRAIVKPHILTHVIDGFIIEESKVPFPVTSGVLSDANTAYKDANNRPQQKLKRPAPAPEPVQEGGMLRCEFCGKMASPRRFKRSKRFCSMSCAKRYNVGCTKRLGLFPREPEKPEKTRHKMKLQLKAKPLKGQRGKHGRLTYNVAQPWSKQGQLEGSDPMAQHHPPETSSSNSSTAPSEDMEHHSSSAPPSPNAAPMSPASRSDQSSFPYSDDASDDLPPGVDRDPGSWSVDGVATFIRSLPGCGDYAEQFLAQEIDGQALMLLKEDHLMSALNMKLGPALKIINKINSLKGQ